ncbi:retinol-binding protein pinta [Musca domestica]|uniref:Retinol-binding protein pinta n=1 Tax=Musca domestica TaxID=7370 RepID=A0A1I8MH80_MUSDO|nr:retinol-binding protein pinta [Musca domestica]
MSQAVRPLSPKLQKIAIEELNEDPLKIPGFLYDFKNWIKEQKYLHVRHDDDQFLIQFLRASRYDLQEAEKKLDYFHAFRTRYPEFFETNVDSPKVRATHELGVTVPLPTPLNDCGSRIVVYRYTYDPNRWRMEDLAPVCTAMHELMILNDPYACICGLTYILDMSQANMQHILQYTPSMVKKIALFYEKWMPLNMKGFYFINVHPGVELVATLFMNALSKELQEKVFICGKDLSKIADRIPLKYLPKEYGGENGSLTSIVQDYHNIWNENREYFRENRKYGTDEALRPGGKLLDFDGQLKEEFSLKDTQFD